MTFLRPSIPSPNIWPLVPSYRKSRLRRSISIYPLCPTHFLLFFRGKEVACLFLKTNLLHLSSLPSYSFPQGLLSFYRPFKYRSSLEFLFLFLPFFLPSFSFSFYFKYSYVMSFIDMAASTTYNVRLTPKPVT